MKPIKRGDLYFSLDNKNCVTIQFGNKEKDEWEAFIKTI